MITIYHGIKTQIMTTKITMIWRPWWWKKEWWWQKQCWQWWWQKSDNDDAKKNACDGKVCSHSLRPPDWGILASSQLQLASTQSYSPSGIWRPSSSLPTSSTALNTQSTATPLIFPIEISNQNIQRNKYQRSSFMKSSSSSAGPSHWPHLWR